MTESAREAKREYEKRWRAANPDKVRAKNRRYWEKRAAKKMPLEFKRSEEANQNDAISENPGGL